MSIFEKGLITILAVDVLFAVLSIPLILRKVPRNAVYGYRTRSTLSDDTVWYEANAHFGRGLLVACLVSAVAMLALYRAAPVSPQVFMQASIASLVVPSIVAALATARFIRSLTRRASSDTRPR
jgi:uncharacterized membrane protein